jgi:hypothetical protein
MVHIPTSMLDVRDNPLISRKPPVVQAPASSPLNLANTSPSQEISFIPEALEEELAGEGFYPVTDFSKLVKLTAKKFKLDPSRAIRQFEVENARQDPKVISPAGATGLMQIMPAVFEGARDKEFPDGSEVITENDKITDPRANLRVWAYEMLQLKKMFGAGKESLGKVYAAYNSGLGNITKLALELDGPITVSGKSYGKKGQGWTEIRKKYKEDNSKLTEEELNAKIQLIRNEFRKKAHLSEKRMKELYKDSAFKEIMGYLEKMGLMDTVRRKER